MIYFLIFSWHLLQFYGARMSNDTTDNISKILSTLKKCSQTSICIRITWWVCRFSPLSPIPTFWNGSENLHFYMLFDSEAGGPQISPLTIYYFKNHTCTSNWLAQEMIQFWIYLNTQYLLYCSSFVHDIKLFPDG